MIFQPPNLPKTGKEKTISDLYAYVDERNAKRTTCLFLDECFYGIINSKE